MPYYAFKEIWTPLTPFKIRLYRCIEDNRLFIKVGKNPRKALF
ncbi:hypothetical protein JOC85_002542 [Bacillus mesophilus]|nr:hypothetical protein [Bacillus mesophilus]MBM7661739.1 hypothetical protein [Bacillus mesophilus]